MKRKWIYGLIVLFVFILFGSAMAWLLGTESGARWLFDKVTQWSSSKIETEGIRGRVWGNLHLDGLRVAWPSGEFRGQALLLRWEPLYLLSGKIVLTELSIEDVRLQDHGTPGKKTPELRWPKITGILNWLSVEARTVHIHRFELLRPDQPSLTVDDLSAQIQWQTGLLKLKEVTLRSPSGLIAGTMEVDFMRPNLRLDLKGTLPNETGGVDTVLLKLQMASKKDSETIGGSFSLVGQSGSVERLRCEGDLSLEKQGIFFRRLQLSQPGREMKVTGEGEILLTEGRSYLRARLKLAGLDFSKESTLPISLRADVEGESDFTRYSGSFRIENAKAGWQAAHLSGSFHGDSQGVDVSIVEGDLIGGTVKGRVGVAWAQALSVNGRLEGRNLNPSKITSGWEGQINLNLEGRLTWPERGEPEGSVRGRLLESRLHGRELTGVVTARLERGLFRFDRIDLHGKGFDLSARGTLHERFDFAVHVNDLSRLVPGAQGSFRGTGWAHAEKGDVSGSLEGQGRGLSFAEIAIGSIDLSAQIDDPKNDSTRIKVEAQKITYRTIRLDAAHLEASGRLIHHSAVFDGRWPEGEVQAALEGGYENGNWQGRLLRLSGKDRITGPWSLSGPATFSASSRELKLRSFIVNSSQRETLTVDGDLGWAPLRGFVKAEWQGFNLARLNPFLRERRLTGQTTGGLQARWSDGIPMELTGTVTFSGTYTVASRTVQFSEGNVKLRWDHAGLEGLGSLVTQDGGQLAGRVSSPQPYRMAWPEQGKLEASWKSIDLALLQSWLPSGLNIEGKLSGRVSGNWYVKGRFDGSGTVSLGRAVVRLKTDSGLIQDNLSKADFEWSWKEEGLRGEILLSFAKYGSVETQFQFSLPPRFPITLPSRGPVQFSLEGHFPEMGVLHNLLPRWVRECRGKMDLLLNLGGSWETPALRGRVALEKTSVTLLSESPQTTSRKASLTPTEPSLALRIDISRSHASFDWNGKGLTGSWEMALNPTGKLQGHFSSSHPMRFGFPESGKLTVNWEAIDLQYVRPLIPRDLALEGSVSGQLEGQWLPGARMDLSGNAGIGQGNLRWEGREGTINASLRTADLRWVWRNEDLQGTLSLVLADYGSLEGRFQLPLPARLPLTFRSRDSFDLSVQGRFQEKGLVSALFPGLVQETQGNVDFKVQGTGRWEKPSWQGDFNLTQAKAYLPGAGIRMEALSVEAQLRGSQLRVTNFRTRSGPGYIEGDATLELENWSVGRFQGKLKGERFQTVYLPELQMFSSPRLEFDGTKERISVRGDIQIPELLIRDRLAPEVIRSSKDVVVVDAPEPEKQRRSSPIDLNIRVLLGDRVFVRMQGANVRLMGQVDLKMEHSDSIAADGEVSVAEGYYIAFGQRLAITRGRVMFKGPLGRPDLDILATRKIKGGNEVIAGVIVTGNLLSPTVRLYSQPAMPETDILSYIILGEPLAKDKIQTNILSATGVLLSAGESVILQNRVREHFGSDTLESDSKKQGTIARSISAIGKYIQERFYVSLGGSPFTDTYLITLRYTISKRWEIETKTGSPGSPSGATLYFKIDFK